MRRVHEENQLYLDKDTNFKEPLHQGEGDKYFVVTRNHIKFKGKLMHVGHRVWQELYFNYRDFVESYNSKIKDNEYTDGIDATDNL